MLRRLAIASAALVLVSLPSGDAGALEQAHHPKSYWGTTHAPDGVLKRGCHDYPYRYVVRPHGHSWGAQLFLIDPAGRGIASAIIDSQSNPTRGHRIFRLCKASTQAGDFLIRMKVTTYNGYQGTVHLAKPSMFHLRPPR